eukprot:1161851-Pelagomonas_calceolata.AAC.6
MVMNIGNRPTVNKGDEEPSVEVHTLHKFARDFYGQVSQAWCQCAYMLRDVPLCAPCKCFYKQALYLGLLLFRPERYALPLRKRKTT